MARSRRIRRSLLLSALVVASALVLRPVAAAAQPLPRLPKTVWELYLPEEYQACGVAYGIYARLPETDRAKLHAGTKVPLDASKLTRDQAGVLTAWFNSARWGCDPPAEQLEANAVGGSTVVLKCENNVVEFCLQSPGQKIWKKLTIASAPGRAEWVRDGLPLLPTYIGESVVDSDWGGGTLPPGPVRERWSVPKWYAVRDLYSAYANLPADVLRELHQGRDVSLPRAKLPGRDQDALARAIDAEYAMHNRIAGWPEETLRTPEMRRRHFGIATVTFTYRRSHPDWQGWPHGGGDCLRSFPRPHRVVYLQLHFSPWAVQEKLKYWIEFGASGVGYAKGSPAFLVAMPAEVQRRLCAFLKEWRQWVVRWHDERDGSHYRKPGAPPPPKVWP